MALQWRWDEKIGEAIIRQTIKKADGTEETKEYTKTLYDGNCFMIFLSEWNDDGVDKYALYSFFADENHAKILLGLKADSTGDKRNIFEGGIDTLTKLRINKKNCRNYKKIVSLFAQAFDNIEIEIYSEEKKNDTKNT